MTHVICHHYRRRFIFPKARPDRGPPHNQYDTAARVVPPIKTACGRTPAFSNGTPELAYFLSRMVKPDSANFFFSFFLANTQVSLLAELAGDCGVPIGRSFTASSRLLDGGETSTRRTQWFISGRKTPAPRTESVLWGPLHLRRTQKKKKNNKNFIGEMQTPGRVYPLQMVVRA